MGDVFPFIWGGIAIFIFAMMLYPVVLDARRRRCIKNMPKCSADELRQRFEHGQDVMVQSAAIRELHERNEDITFAFPRLLDMALSRNAAKALIGKSHLVGYFPEAVRDIEINPQKLRLSKEARKQLESLRDNLDWPSE